MARVNSEKQVNAFVKGLITEASPLTYPENASLDEDNFVLNRDGSRSLRFGMDYESGFELTYTGYTSGQISATKIDFFKWDYAGGDESISLGVVRIQDKLWFMNLLEANPSANLKNSGLPLSISGLGNSTVDFTLINHKLILVSDALLWPQLLDYNPSTDVVSNSDITVQIRDFFGVDDTLDLTTRPLTLTAEHKYNLRNQGWGSTIVSTCGTDAIVCTFTTKASYPSNADIWSLGKRENSADATTFEKYDPDMLFRSSQDNSPAPKGKAILDLYTRGASRNSAFDVTGLSGDTESGRITTVASYAGRVFFSGIISQVTNGDKFSPNYSGYIFFSPTVISTDKLGKCYQEADPTSDSISDIIDTDGGTIQIPEITRVIKLIPTKSSLLILAENGVWEVYGGDNGFRATEYQLNKITSVGVIGKDTIISADGIIAYWSKGGIYILTPDQTTGRLVAQNLSLGTIQTFYNNIPDVSKRYAKVVFDEKEQTVRWMYNDSATYNGTSDINKYTKELVFDVSLGAFYKQSIGSVSGASPYVAGYITIPNFVSSSISNEVVVNGDQVQVNTIDVEVITSVPTTRRAEIAFLSIVPGAIYSFTISRYIETSFMDWKIFDGTGVPISAYLITGYELFGDILRKKHVPYILFYFKRTEDGFTQSGNDFYLNNRSSCFVQAQWNWTDSANSGKWGSEFQAYRLNRLFIPTDTTFDYGEGVIITKNKLRGSGRCLSLKIRNEVGKDMKLLGWAIRMSGNAEV